MKAVISNKIYMLVDDKQYRDLSKELTYTIPSRNPEAPIVIKNLITINKNMPGGKKLVAFPSGRTDLIPENYAIEDKRVLNKVKIPILNNIELRESQKKFIEFCDDSCILNAKPGWGKTFTAAVAAASLRQKTLIIVHTIALRTQWETEIIKATGIKPGIIGTGKYNVDPPIVIANTQSLIKHLPKIKHLFGTIILDEMHHVASPTFTKIIDVMFARYKIGLTGTLRRKDGKEVVFSDYFGKKVYKPPVENTLQPVVEVHSPKFRIPPGSTWAERENQLSQDPSYQAYIVWLADKYVKKGHKVLIVSDRISLLQDCYPFSENRAACVIGTSDREEAHKRMRAGELDELWGSINIYSEGVSINCLSCVILACPINNDVRLEQLIGRINREEANKINPVVVDIKFSCPTGINQFKTRSTFYRQEGYNVRYVENKS